MISQDRSNQTFEKISQFFCTLCKNRYNLRMWASIRLKFGAHIGGLKENTIIIFGINMINIQGVISNFMHKTKSNFFHAYRVKCIEEQAENWYVASLNIRGVHFGG